MSVRADGYATAIFEVARAEGSLEKVENELFALSHALEGSDELRQALSDQATPPETRQAIVEELLDGKASDLTKSLVAFVVGAGRARELAEIIEKVVERSAAERESVVAEVRSAMPLDDDQRRRLGESLSSNLGKKVDVKVVVDKSVMGGLFVRVGDVVIDGTVRHRLDQLRETL